jgi:hypothetical protein
VQSAGDPEQNGAVPIHIPGSANASLLSKIAATAKTILNRIIEASLSVTDVEGTPGWIALTHRRRFLNNQRRP